MRATVELQGLETVVRELERRKLDVMAGLETICHAGAMIVEAAIEAKAPASVAEDIVRETTARRPTAVEVSVGPVKSNRVAKWLEYGTKPHRIPRQRGKKMRFKRLLIEGRFAMYANHPGARPRPFVRPGFEESKPAAQAAMGTATKRAVGA